MEGKSLFKLNGILKSNSLANTETEKHGETGLGFGGHKTSRWRTLSNPLVPKCGKILSHRLKQNKKTPQQSSLSLLSPLYFPLFLKSSTTDLSSSPLKEMACGKTASDLVAEVNDQENEITKST